MANEAKNVRWKVVAVFRLTERNTVRRIAKMLRVLRRSSATVVIQDALEVSFEGLEQWTEGLLFAPSMVQ